MISNEPFIKPEKDTNTLLQSIDTVSQSNSDIELQETTFKFNQIKILNDKDKDNIKDDNKYQQAKVQEEFDIEIPIVKTPILERVKSRLGFILIVSSAFIYSIYSLLIGVVVKSGMHILEIILLRTVIGLMGGIIFLLLIGENPLGDKSKRLILVFRGISSTGSMVCIFYTISVLPLGDAIAMSCSTLLFSGVLGSTILKEKWTKTYSICTILSIVGVFIISKPSFIFGSVLGAFFQSVSNVFSRKIGKDTNPFIMVVYYQSIAMLILLPVCLILNVWRAPSLIEWFYLFCMGVLGFIFQGTANRAFQIENVAKMSPLTYTEIIFTYILQIIFFKESPDLFSIFGSICIILCAFVSPKEKRLLLSVRGLFGTFAVASVFFTFTVLPLSDAVCVSFTTPVFTAALACIVLKEKWGYIDAISTILSFIGVGIISKPSFIFGSSVKQDSSEPDSGLRFIYISIGLIGSFFSACAYVAVRKIGSGTNALVMVSYFSSVAILLTLPASFLLQSFKIPNLIDSLLLIGMGVSGLGYQAFLNKSLQKEKAAKASAMSYTQIIFSLLMEVTILKERPDLLTIIGTLIILSCSIFAFRK
ncbi:hypothetical protein PPL_06887 [Heterostelium album PN500]|uniref:EamA domain-containing protein n=1 Tax=Heterostelium pallidum (strain ATCC 26659 / Pp 5 / PN500) TaxID=670386 RepID=D3BDT4_HETP5|nr:hypothetical protein PPL_06887 [Heterostelium album PN500]EFA80065.1 hypothetical protein PPL_06887 [Heterostelium album PN500]|eukprot:XP_020432185.1 hypothetical protein PPL_06887 [Heterostelium album PN500]